MWALGDSYERSEQHYKYVFEDSPEAYFVVAQSGIVLHCNLASRKLAATLGTVQIRSGITDIFSIFQEENAVKLREMIKTSMKGEVDEKELILRRLSAGDLWPDQLTTLGAQARSQPLCWKHGLLCVLITFEDVTLYVARRHIVTERYRSLYEGMMKFQRELEELSDRQEAVAAKYLCSFHKLYMDYGNALLLQAYILGRADIKKEAFHLRMDTENACEMVSFRCAERLLDLILTREEAFPTAIFCDRFRYSHLIINLLNFAAENAKPGSEVSLHCSIAVIPI